MRATCPFVQDTTNADDDVGCWDNKNSNCLSGHPYVCLYLQQKRHVGRDHDEGGLQGGLEVVDNEARATHGASKQVTWRGGEGGRYRTADAFTAG